MPSISDFCLRSVGSKMTSCHSFSHDYIFALPEVGNLVSRLLSNIVLCILFSLSLYFSRYLFFSSVILSIFPLSGLVTWRTMGRGTHVGQIIPFPTSCCNLIFFLCVTGVYLVYLTSRLKCRYHCWQSSIWLGWKWCRRITRKLYFCFFSVALGKLLLCCVPPFLHL